MTRIAEIEDAIATLPREDFSRLEAWFDSYRERVWDCQIEADSASGALDFLLREAEEEIAAGRARPADELLHDGNV